MGKTQGDVYVDLLCFRFWDRIHNLLEAPWVSQVNSLRVHSDLLACVCVAESHLRIGNRLFGRSGRPLGPGRPKRWGAQPPTFWKGFRGRRGRPLRKCFGYRCCEAKTLGWSCKGTTPFPATPSRRSHSSRDRRCNLFIDTCRELLVVR